MARGKLWDETTRAEILRLATEEKTSMEISEAMNLNYHSVRSFLARERRKAGAIRDCESCGKTIKDVEAVFCPYCGKKILTEKDRVMEHLNDIGKCIGDLPGAYRDRIVANMAEIRKYIKEH